MRKIKKVFISFLMINFIFLNLSTFAYAYTFTGKKWLTGSHTGLKYDHISNSSWRNAIYNARIKWNNVGANIWIEYNTSSDNWVILKAGGYANNGALMTTITYNIGSITYECDIYVNTNFPWATDGSANAYDFQSAITHELGHYLGLGHSYDSYVMLPTLNIGEIRRNLNGDDIAGLWQLYGGR